LNSYGIFIWMPDYEPLYVEPISWPEPVNKLRKTMQALKVTKSTIRNSLKRKFKKAREEFGAESEIE